MYEPFHLFPHPNNNKVLHDKWIVVTLLKIKKLPSNQHRENYSETSE